MRADAQRNRQKVLAAAVTAFAEEGLSVPVAQIARRAGVGTGTVGRHFPTKESLYTAIVLEGVKELTAYGATLLESAEPGAAFFDFFARFFEMATGDRGLAQAFAGAGFDMYAVARESGYDMLELETKLLLRAQQAGEIRNDVSISDIKPLLLGCLPLEKKTQRRALAVITDGLHVIPADSSLTIPR